MQSSIRMFSALRSDNKRWKCAGKLILLTALLLCSGSLCAQPGGGGGVIFKGLYNGNGQSIDLQDSSLRIRLFLLADSSKGAQVTQELYPQSPLSLPPNTYRSGISKRVSFPYQRLLLNYKGETMIVDCLHVLDENGAGVVMEFDSLVFQSGYFRYYITWSKMEIDDSVLTDLWQLFYHGITPYTIQSSPAKGWIRDAGEPDTSFLREKNLPATWYLRRGEELISQNRADSGIIDILTSRRKGLSKVEDRDALMLLAIGYRQTKQYQKGIDAVSRVITSALKGRDTTLLTTCYHIRISIFTASGEFDKALSDYDAVIALSSYKLGDVIGKARHRVEQMKDCAGAIDDLKVQLETIPNDYMADRPFGTSDYVGLYFMLGNAEYCNGEYSSAFRHWLKAMEFGGGREHFVRHFDSIIARHPDVSELYLARALAMSGEWPYNRGGKAEQKLLNGTLADIAKAQETGMNDARIYLYRAETLQRLKKYEEALAEINAGIAADSTEPRLFIFRHAVRSRLEPGKPEDLSDPDLETYRRLMRNWNFKER